MFVYLVKISRASSSYCFLCCGVRQVRDSSLLKALEQMEKAFTDAAISPVFQAQSSCSVQNVLVGLHVVLIF